MDGLQDAVNDAVNAVNDAANDAVDNGPGRNGPGWSACFMLEGRNG